MGLLELAPNGGARLIPVVIMIDGQFYDASAYKAQPVPMALYVGTVYEAERAGTSLGLFTVSSALLMPNQTWLGQGTWLPAGSAPPKTSQKAEDKPRGIDDDRDKPPVLVRRSPPEKPKPAEPAPQPAAPPAPSAPANSAPAAPNASAPSTPASAPASSAPATPPAGSAPPPAASPATSATPTPAPAPAASAAPPDDSNRPVLRRGTFAIPEKDRFDSSAAVSTTPGSPATSNSGSSANPGSGKAGDVQIIPAISDAAGPEPRPYTYAMKPAEQQQFQQKMLVVAAGEIRARAHELSANTVSAPVPAHPRPQPGRPPAPAKLAPPTFADVQLNVFDLSSSNEPVLILTAKATLPPGKNAGPPGLQYMLTLVAREDIYGELHKIFSAVTDAQHLDVMPRYELIDAVDADGDGRGELLFRKISDAGSAFALYRVIGNQLWPLFEGTPGE